jgi:hypothetical protein
MPTDNGNQNESPRELPAAQMMRLLLGYRDTQAINAAITLGIVDALGAETRSADDIAQQTNTHPPSLLRLLRFLVTIGVTTEQAGSGSSHGSTSSHGSRFALTPLGATLRRDGPDSIRDMAMLYLNEHTFKGWNALTHSVTTGETGFGHVYGTDVWSYRAQHTDYQQIFDAAMAEQVHLVNASITASYDFSPLHHIIDIGGGNGALLIAILKANPGSRGTVFDQPQVVAGAQDRIEAAGLADRLDSASGSFFESVPGGGDAYLLSRVIHDWDDARSSAILKTIRSAMSPHSRLLVIERVVPDRLDTSPGAAEVMMSDLNMLIMTGGRERTVSEYSALFDAAGLKLMHIVSTPSLASIVEAIPS